MKTARFNDVGKPLVIEELPERNVGSTGVLLRISGVCHCDFHVIGGDVGT
jgi:D-arabinose 1-dehydrogenase-like Zn-dependent alcohol dehydrogenase